MNNGHLVDVENLVMYFPVTAGVFRRKVADVKAVDDISFYMKKGETFGLVGESGCGKTTTGRCILQLEEVTGGTVRFEGKNLLEMKGQELRRMRRHMQLIFQDPFASLDPRMTAGDIIGEPLLVHGIAKGKAYREQVSELLRMVELEPYMAVGNDKGSGSPGPWRYDRLLSYAMSRYPHWMYLSRHRLSRC
jgi:ABC-type oligopeptide transport system ATPase subunit